MDSEISEKTSNHSTETPAGSEQDSTGSDDDSATTTSSEESSTDIDEEEYRLWVNKFLEECQNMETPENSDDEANLIVNKDNPLPKKLRNMTFENSYVKPTSKLLNRQQICLKNMKNFRAAGSSNIQPRLQRPFSVKQRQKVLESLEDRLYNLDLDAGWDPDIRNEPDTYFGLKNQDIARYIDLQYEGDSGHIEDLITLWHVDAELQLNFTKKQILQRTLFEISQLERVRKEDEKEERWNNMTEEERREERKKRADLRKKKQEERIKMQQKSNRDALLRTYFPCFYWKIDAYCLAGKIRKIVTTVTIVLVIIVLGYGVGPGSESEYNQDIKTVVRIFFLVVIIGFIVIAIIIWMVYIWTIKGEEIEEFVRSLFIREKFEDYTELESIAIQNDQTGEREVYEIESTNQKLEPSEENEDKQVELEAEKEKQKAPNTLARRLAKKYQHKFQSSRFTDLKAKENQLMKNTVEKYALDDKKVESMLSVAAEREKEAENAYSLVSSEQMLVLAQATPKKFKPGSHRVRPSRQKKEK